MEELGLELSIISIIKANLAKQGNRLVMLQVRANYSEEVNTRHCAPKGIKTSWYVKEGVPFYYHGWIGRVWAIYAKRSEGFSSSIFRASGLHSGSGGYGYYNRPLLPGNFKIPSEAYSIGYSCRLFVQDFPEYKAAVLLDLTPKNSPFNFRYLNPNYIED